MSAENANDNVPENPASESASAEAKNPESFDIDAPPPGSVIDLMRPVLEPLSSLKLTVAMFACSLFLVMIGTLAQVDLDIWDVVADYFRCWFAWIPLRSLHPLFARIEILEPVRDFLQSRDSSVGIWFPGGFLIGAVMTTNLVAAFILKFRIQAKGQQLVAGSAVSLIGLFGVGIAIASGDSQTGLQEAGVDWDVLWTCLKVLTVALLAVNVWGIVETSRKKKAECFPLIGSAFLLCVAGYYLFFSLEERFNDSSMRILWQLIKGEAPALVLLAGFLLLFKKRGGVVLVHAGVALMMFNEVLVHVEHIETQMTIEEGDTVAWSKDIRSIEIAFVDSESDPENNLEVVVPKELILAAAKAQGDDRIINDPKLPFVIRVDQFLQNSDPVNLKPGEKNPATHGAGTKIIAKPVKAGVGTDTGGAVDLTSTYVTLLDPESKKELGSFLLGVYFQLVEDPTIPPNIIEHDGKTWNLALRFKRYYKPYSVYLSDVSKKDYIGTNTPRDYRSVVTITEADGTSFERDIWMNNPLRYAGETFYQSNYTPANPRTGAAETTTLQVVRNTGWMVPYVSCMIVGTGLLAHFWLVLIRFLQRRGATRTLKVGLLASFGGLFGFTYTARAIGDEMLSDDDEQEDETGLHKSLAAKFKPAKPAADLSEPEVPESRNAYIVSWVLAVLVAGWLLRHAVPPRTESGKADLVAFGELPLVYEGRTKPFDTLARNSLRVLSNRTTFITEVEVKDDNGKVVKKDGKPKTKEFKNPAILWLLDLMTDPEVASRHRVFRIDSPHVQKILKLERRKGFMYALDEFYEPVIDGTLAKQADVARKKDEGKRSADDRKLLELERKLGLYSLLMNSFNPPGLPPVPENQQDMMAVQEFFMGLQQAKRQLDGFDERQPPLSVPPIEQEDDGEVAMPTDKWQTYARGVFTAFVQRQVQGQEPSEPVVLFMEILAAHGDKDAKVFNEKVKQYKSWLKKNGPEDVSVEMASFESYFNHFSPAYYSAFAYLFAFIFACAALLGWSKTLNRAALLTIIATFFVHTFALWARMEISGRPPVTNLYSSAVFIGWGGVLLGVGFEAIYRNGIGNVIASALGAITLGIAYLLSGDGDTFKVLQAVLDTQFWLATHVVCITLGYSTTFIAGTLGQFYVLTGFSSRKLTPTMSKDLSRMIYGTVCFGIFFSFVGTVLGGLWADDSWGRFWGWDPKENGALLIVIWNALVLHARWDGMVKDRGLAVLAVVGNIITSWSWFGVNELGVGLHSYGQSTSPVWATLFVFWLSQVAVIIVGVMPRGFWTSFRAWDRKSETSSKEVDGESGETNVV